MGANGYVGFIITFDITRDYRLSKIPELQVFNKFYFDGSYFRYIENEKFKQFRYYPIEIKSNKTLLLVIPTDTLQTLFNVVNIDF